MKLNGTTYRSVWRDPDGAIRIFDQTKLPWTVEILRLSDTAQVAEAGCGAVQGYLTGRPAAPGDIMVGQP